MSKVYFKKHHIDNISVKNKLLLIYVLCILIPVVLTYIIFLSMTENNLKNQQKEQVNASLLRTKNQLYKGIDDAILTLYNIMTDRSIKDALDMQYDSYQEYYVAYNGLLRDALKKNNFIVKIINKVNIFTENKTIPNSDGYTYIDDNIKNSAWYKHITAVEGKRFSFIFYVENGKRYFSLVKDLNHFADGFDFSNILKIDFMDTAIIQILNTEKISGEVYLVNEKNEIIYTTDNKYESTPQNIPAVFDINAEGESNLIFKTNLDRYTDLKDWNLIMVVNESYITDAFREPVKIILGMGSIFLVFTFVVISIISYSIKYRLNLLRTHIKKGRNQSFEIVECYEGKDEIGDVIKEFNRMAMKIQELITSICEVKFQKQNIEIERRQAEMNALQSQINPHFLYNLLESIRMRSVLKKETETAQILKYVSKMFRRLLQWDDDMITVKEELDYVEDYLVVQKYRFGDKIDYKVSVDNEAVNYKIPKMIFQPLVENACIHGLQNTKNGGSISVIVKLADNHINCIIKDNGIGIPEEKLKNVLDNMCSDSYGKNSIGIKNVYNRLNLIYGSKSQLKIESTEGEGTSVFISIPTNV